MLSLEFLIGFIALIIFFGVIVLSLLGIIPQHVVPIQTALFTSALAISGLALVGSKLSPQVMAFGLNELAGKIILHPITALAAGFMVAGALEAAGSFEALSRIFIRLSQTALGVPGTITLLVNMPTLFAMPCGRILGAALFPSALMFGWRVAELMKNDVLVGVVIFSFIANAAASCGPSLLGGIGLIGEGMGRLPLGSLSPPQSTGIMLGSGIVAITIRYISPILPRVR